MLLSQLLTKKLPALFERKVTGLSLDNRTVSQGHVFLALAGTKTHGEVYIHSALQKGAVAVLKETSTHKFEMLAGNIPCISLPNLSQQVGDIAAQFYDHPSRSMCVTGVTGTNGKTSVTHAIAGLLHPQVPCGLLGTLGYGIYGELQPGSHTTPDAIRLQALFAHLQTQNIRYLAMEVSSHALAQGRVNGITYNTAVFTNLSRDHLDYHQTMAQYAQAKQRLFTMSALKTAIINLDDAFGATILAALPGHVTPLTYSIRDEKADVYANISAFDSQGTTLDISTPWGNGQGQSSWFGPFNVSNLLAALTVLLNLGFPLPQLLTQLSTLRAVPGRMERFGQAHQPTVIIDYAHTPDALEKVLLALQKHLNMANNDKSTLAFPFSTNVANSITSFSDTPNLWCVFGCGGDRDRGKRRLMGEIAQRYADKVIITDDNPRHEPSKAIIDDIREGCPTPTAIISDRQQAICHALQNAKLSDVILIAGKGHEDYQQIGDKRLPFSDRMIVSSLLNY